MFYMSWAIKYSYMCSDWKYLYTVWKRDIQVINVWRTKYSKNHTTIKL